jgi:hypothetical protein
MPCVSTNFDSRLRIAAVALASGGGLARLGGSALPVSAAFVAAAFAAATVSLARGLRLTDSLKRRQLFGWLFGLVWSFSGVVVFGLG